MTATTAPARPGSSRQPTKETGHALWSRSRILEHARFLAPPPTAWGVFAPNTGVLFADRILADLVAWLVACGAALIPLSQAAQVDPDRAAVNLDSGISIIAERDVVVSGAWTPQLLPHFSRRIAAVRSTVAYIAAEPSILTRWRRAPSLFLATKQAHLYALPPVAGTGLMFGGAPVLRSGAPRLPTPIFEADACATLVSVREFLAEPGGYSVSGAAAGCYADTSDKRFIFERFERAFAITGCSGRMFEFGSLAGRRAAEWVYGACTD